ncbi:GDP-L-fucose synthase family protein [Ilyobacter polytropus]|uniref:GDP-L-fucose synthase n=1 Tax=Ilyobacter polytropus (strain ATCC 51220 / DSM 2926 / LMG 16218 / CuHBu1) TaxID=572544 RepID=E3H7A6_ILYPC|nr:GDP-L-fucose synthase [Ilyobacter polytropus]ADO82587.1 NAD-dependent epimerase/dehydratase [Ilyobacter polytropus DSM 2926]
MELNSKIYLAGHNGLVGSSLLNNLKSKNYKNIVTKDFSELDLRKQDQVEKFFEKERPEYVFLIAAKVGGIHANNTYPAEFIYDNLMIEANVINSAHKYGVKKLLFLGSACIYPKFAGQPIKEEYLLTGELEPTNKAYAIAKISGIELCKSYRRQYGDDFICAMPTNLYGPKDNFDLKTSHVMPALIRKFHDGKKNGSKEVVVWGTGKPTREFLFVEDLTDALIHLMNNYSEEGHINIGTGIEIELNNLVHLIKKVVGYEGEVVFDTTKPDGTPRRSLDVAKIHATGWRHQIELEEGIREVYKWYLENKD